MDRRRNSVVRSSCRRPLTRAAAGVAAFLAFGLPCALTAQEGAARLSEEQFDKQSLALRTSLHYDASLETPLAKLVELYRGAGRAEELVTLYRTHVTQYPADAGAHAVLVQVLQALKKPEATSMVRLGVERHPGSALLAYLSYRDLEGQRDPRALDELSRAVGLEKNPGRRSRWVDELVRGAKAEGRGELAEATLRAEAEVEGLTADGLAELGRRALGAEFPALALELLGRAAAAKPAPETGVEIELLSAEAEAAAGDARAAGARLDALLGRVAADYWRRPEIVVRRVNLLGSDAARELRIKEARERYAGAPGDEGAALDLAELLEAAGLRRDALDILLEASGRAPASERLEKRALDLLDRTGDERRAVVYLAERLEAQPGRRDLAYRQVKALYLTGDREGARERSAALFEGVSDGERAKQLLELGRFLRRSSLAPDAAAVLEEVVALLPERLDVRRELAETYAALGRRDEARALFSGDFGDGVEIENFLDAAGYLIAEGMLAEAKRALEGRLEAEATNFDLWLLMVEVAGKSGDRSGGETRLEGARALVDTGVRYARWLETGVSFHELFDAAESFLDAEEGRYVGDAGSWEADTLARFLIFCETSRRHERDEALAAVLRERLEGGGLDAATELRLRRMLVGVLERDPNFSVEVQGQLRLLAEGDVANRASYQLRLAKMYHSANRPDLARPLLEGLAFSEIGDASVLGGSEGMLLEYAMYGEAVEALGRLAELEPTSLATWQRWLSVLAAQGDEAGLRRVVRRLLAGGSQSELSDGTYALLRGHLADSYWRSVGRLLADGDDRAAAEEVLALLGSIERAVDTADDRLWVLWTRAHVLDRLGRQAATGQAVAELEDAVERPGGTAEASGGEAMIYFPDGLALPVAAAVKALRDGDRRAVGAGEDVAGPAAGVAVDWMYETRNGETVVQVEEAGEAGVVVVARDGGVALLGRGGGKVLWEKEGLAEIVADPARTGGANQVVVRRTGRVVQTRFRSQRELEVVVPARVVAGEGGRLFVPMGDRVGCVDLADGSLLWESAAWESLPKMPVPNQRGGSGQAVPPMRLFADGTRVVVFSPEAGVAAGLLATNGKVLWERKVVEDGERRRMPMGLASGADYSAGRLFVYGHQPLVLDGATGEILWAVEAGRVREFPVVLEVADDGSSDAFPTLGIAGLGSTGQRSTLSYQGLNSMHPYYVRQFVEGQGKLVATAVQWAERLAEGEIGAARLVGRRLLLMGGDGVRVLSLDLPLGGSAYATSGVYVGGSGNKAVILARGGQGLVVYNLTRGDAEVFDIKAAGQGGEPGAVRAAVAGARAYVAGPDGVLCVNIHTGGTVFFQAWPEEVVDWLPDVETSGGLPATPMALIGQSRQQPITSTYWEGLAKVHVGRQTTCFGMVNSVGEGRLYAVVGGNRVVALGDVEQEGGGGGDGE